ncbi:Y-family DNA polymerase [Crenobacter cavernae]|uniref:Y-family DNA polymerase n=1 Tax=Crenobacter cavernae TaxID=2290923 RepID=A0ABY0FGM7_9NEIS|nr:Y-family DNA polymerase [Crenobacter cavernae]RXZ45549.1 Y-family DNA polymerase [Crenobacter cavernae]
MNTQRCFLQVDCNNFFASCETVFDPSLAGRPLVVLSNNDGCVISRSAEARRAGVPMGAPLFEVRDRLKRLGAVVMSSNYTLYGDMSNRVMALLAHYARSHEVYSVDECFLDVTGEADPVALARRIRDDVLRGLGLPVCVGIGPTKTLAKTANRIAKGDPNLGGVFSFMDLSATEREARLAELAVEEVWGINRRLGTRLRLVGIADAAALVRTDRDFLRRRFSVVMARLADELSGVACLDIDDVASKKKMILSSRSFGRKVTSLAELQEAAAMHAALVAEKLRTQRSHAGFLQVTIRSSPHASEPYVRDSTTVGLLPVSNDSRRLIAAARDAVAHLYRRHVRYAKVGVCALELSDVEHVQDDLFAGRADADARGERLMAAVDAINRKFGRGKLKWASEGAAQPWQGRRDNVSPRYTTHKDELPIVKAN